MMEFDVTDPVVETETAEGTAATPEQGAAPSAPAPESAEPTAETTPATAEVAPPSEPAKKTLAQLLAEDADLRAEYDAAEKQRRAKYQADVDRLAQKRVARLRNEGLAKEAEEVADDPDAAMAFARK